MNPPLPFPSAVASAFLLAVALGESVRAQTQPYRPLSPLVRVPAISVYGRAYPPASPKLKAALLASKGDREESEVTFVVSEYTYRRDYRYRGQQMATTSLTRFDPRSGTYTSLSSMVTIDSAGRRNSTIDTTPVQVTAESRAYYCQSADGGTRERIDVKSKCMVIHRVTRAAKSTPTHGWNPVDVGVILFTEPEPTGCAPTTATPRSLKYEVSMTPGEVREFPVEAAGFRNEACNDPTDTVLYFPPIAHPNDNPDDHGK
jgi:hypothetical protein